VYFTRQFGLAGRLVGKRGRKQRQTSEALATNSLGEKSSIVVFRDVPRARKEPVDRKKESNYVDLGEQSLKGLSLTPEEIEAALSGTGQTPDEEEVTKSIEALRPQAPVIEDEEFDRLIKELLDSYNLKQLSRYLSQSLKSHHASTTVVRELEYKGRFSTTPPKAKRVISFTRSRWQPGRTPLDVRRISALPAPSRSRGKPLGGKATAADRIVRVVWEITKRTDEQKMGELEVHVPPWALAMLFDVASPRNIKYQKMIEPALLLQRSEIQPYRMDNVIRITARRQDANDIATQLENKVLLIGKMVVPIDHLIPTSAAAYPKGQPLQYFRQQDINEISNRTQCTFMQQKDGTIGIYSFKQQGRDDARRLLLGLLNLQSRKIKHTTLGPSIHQSAKAGPLSLALVPVFPDRGLHFRDRSKTLARTVLPIRREMPTIATRGSYYGQADGMSRKILSLVNDFEQHNEEEPAVVGERSLDPSIYWAGRQFKVSHTWWAHLGLLLQESTPDKSGLLLQDKSLHHGSKADTRHLQKQESVFLRQVPGYETLLSYFEPVLRPKESFGKSSDADYVARKSSIVAHFLPSPFSKHAAKALSLFPKLELTMLRKPGGALEETELKIDSLRAITGEHHVDIPLPDRVVDLRLTRKIGAFANIRAVHADPEIQEFVATLKKSANTSKNNTSKNTLHGKTQVTFKLPGWMAESDSEIRKAQDDSLPEIDVPYLFERFEQVQTSTFKKDITVLSKRAEHSAGVRTFNDNFPRGARIQYKEIEAGEIGGRQTEISFQAHKPKDYEPEADQSEGTQLQPHNTIMKSLLVPALAIADFVTRASKNEVTSWRKTSGSERSDRSSSRTTEPEGTDVEEVEDGEARKEDAKKTEAAAETVEENVEIKDEDAETSNEDGEAKKEARSNDGVE
jgi:hypothetical protein